jgi:hypothetical protein
MSQIERLQTGFVELQEKPILGCNALFQNRSTQGRTSISQDHVLRG